MINNPEATPPATGPVSSGRPNGAPVFGKASLLLQGWLTRPLNQVRPDGLPLRRLPHNSDTGSQDGEGVNRNDGLPGTFLERPASERSPLIPNSAKRPLHRPPILTWTPQGHLMTRSMTPSADSTNSISAPANAGWSSAGSLPSVPTSRMSNHPTTSRTPQKKIFFPAAS